jgi:fermentation-respiration switch protein FrsA (DUF1100 family)
MQAMTSVRLLTILGAMAALFLGVVLLAWLFQRKLIYLPLGQYVPPASDVLAGAREISFHTEDGLELAGWFVPGEPGAPAVIVFNGNAGNRSFRAPLAEALTRVGFSVLLFDYRGFGGNPGSPSETGLAADARAARAWLGAQEEVDPRSIVFFGESLGAAVALAAAIDEPPAAVILRSPFTSMTAVGKLHYPFLPVGLLLKDRYPSIERIGGLSCPLLVLAGERDRIVPAAQSRALYDAAPAGRKRLVEIPGAGHNDYELLAGPRLIEEVVRFVGEAT